MDDNLCPVCGDSGYQELELCTRKLRLTAPFSVVICRRCHLKRLHPLPSLESYAGHYAKSAFYNPNNYEVRARQKKRFFIDRLRLLNSIAGDTEGKVLLDFGCAGGHFLEMAKSFGWQPVGVELSPKLASLAKHRLQCKIYNTLDDLIADGVKTDTVHSNHVLEHVTQPRRVFNQIYESLVPDGIFVSEVPYEFGSWNEILKLTLLAVLGNRISYTVTKPPVDSLHHTFFYTPKILKKLLEESGFYVERMMTVNQSYYHGTLIPGMRKYIYQLLDNLFGVVNRGPVILFIARKKG